MGKRRKVSVSAWLRHWRGLMQLFFRLTMCAGVLTVAALLLRWIGPPAVTQFTGDDIGDFQESRRAAFIELGRALKAALVILGVVCVLVLFAVHCSRTPISWVRSAEHQERRERVKAKSEKGSGDEDDNRYHSRITIDPETLEDDA